MFPGSFELDSELATARYEDRLAQAERARTLRSVASHAGPRSGPSPHRLVIRAAEVVVIVALLLVAAVAPTLGSARDPELATERHEDTGQRTVVEVFGEGPMRAISIAALTVATDAQASAIEAVQPSSGKTPCDAPTQIWLAVPSTDPAR